MCLRRCKPQTAHLLTGSVGFFVAFGRKMDPMKAPPRLQALVDEGLIDTVVRQLMSGKEAMVYVVRCGDETRCAKI